MDESLDWGSAIVSKETHEKVVEMFTKCYVCGFSALQPSGPNCYVIAIPISCPIYIYMRVVQKVGVEKLYKKDHFIVAVQQKLIRRKFGASLAQENLFMAQVFLQLLLLRMITKSTILY